MTAVISSLAIKLGTIKGNMTMKNKENFTLSIEQISKEIGNFSKASAKRKEHAHLIALACMIQGADHRNLTPLTEFAKVLTEAEQSCLRLWAAKYSPAVKRTVKGGGFVYKFEKAKEGEQERAFDLDGMQEENFLDVNVEKEIKEQIFGSDNYLKRIASLVESIDKVVKGEKEGQSIKEEDKDKVNNLRNILAGILTVDLEQAVEEVELPQEQEEVKQAA